MRPFYKHGLVTLYQGDARDLDLIPDNSIHLTLTSIPYYNARDYSTWENYEHYLDDMSLAFSQCKRKLVEGGRIAVNVVHGYGRPSSEEGYLPIGNDIAKKMCQIGFDLRGQIIWNKGNGVLGTAWGSYLSAKNPSFRDQHEIIIVGHKGRPDRPDKGESTIDMDTFMKATSSVWNVPPETNSWHPAPWPAEIPRRLIELYTYKGDTVLDPFVGSGTTVWQAEKCGRVGVGVELSGEYLRKAVGELFLATPPT